MAKRQERFSSSRLKVAFPTLQNQLSTLVLRSGRAMQVMPCGFADGSLSVIDMLGKKHTFPVTGIEEVILEKPA